MEITEIDVSYRMGEDILLTTPCVSRLDEVHTLIKGFDKRHQFLSFWPMDSSIQAVARFLLQAEEDFKSDVRYPFMIIERGSGDIVGLVGIERTARIVDAFHIGYWIGSQFMGKGYATQATILARDFVLKKLKPCRLEIMPAATNKGSIRVAVKAGFTPETTLKNAIHGQDRKPVDQVILTFPIEKSDKV